LIGDFSFDSACHDKYLIRVKKPNCWNYCDKMWGGYNGLYIWRIIN